MFKIKEFNKDCLRDLISDYEVMIIKEYGLIPKHWQDRIDAAKEFLKLEKEPVDVTIIWGADKDWTENYTFDSAEEKKAFIKGVESAIGWHDWEPKIED